MFPHKNLFNFMQSPATSSQPAVLSQWRIVGEWQGITAVWLLVGSQQRYGFLEAIILCTTLTGSTSCSERETDKPFQWITSRLDKLLFAGLCEYTLFHTHTHTNTTQIYTNLPLALVFRHVVALVSRCVFQGKMMFLPQTTWESYLCNRIIWRGHSKLT